MINDEIIWLSVLNCQIDRQQLAQPDGVRMEFLVATACARTSEGGGGGEGDTTQSTNLGHK